MDSDTRAEVNTIADLSVRKYMDKLVSDALPHMIEAGIRAHNNDIEAHGGLQKKAIQTKWAMRGFIGALMLMGGAGIERVFSMLF